MPRQRLCLVTSDEEDEDGNLSAEVKQKEITSNQQAESSNYNTRSRRSARKSMKTPINYNQLSLGANSASDRPSVSGKEFSNVNIKLEKMPETNQPKTYSKSQNLHKSSPVKKITMVEIVSVDNSSDSEVNESQIKPNNKTGNESEKSAVVNPPLKTHTSVIEKPKYVRSATPICDAIMREYSRSKKNKGSLESNLAIQELIRKVKEGKLGAGNKPEEMNTLTHETTSVKKKTSEDPPVEKTSCTSTKIVNVESVTNNRNIPSVSDKTNNKQSVNETNIVCNDTQNSNQMTTRKRGRPPKRPVEMNISDEEITDQKRNQKRRNIEGDEDDPDYDPFFELETVTRSGRKVISRLAKKTIEESSEGKRIINTTKPSTVNVQEKVPGPKDKVLSIAERLKSLAEKIADVLKKEDSPNIHKETENLLETTQELLEIQRKAIQNSEQTGNSNIDLHIKKECVDQLLPSHSIDKNTAVESSSLSIFNQLQRHQEVLQKKLSESSLNISQLKNNAKTSSSEHPVKIDDINIPGILSVEEKGTFVMDYYVSFKTIFDDETIHNIIPVLTDNTMLSLNIHSNSSTGTAVTSEDLKQREILIAKVMKSDDINNEISKLMMVTLCLYTVGSIPIRDSKYKNQTHNLRRELHSLLTKHRHYYPKCFEVLRLPDDDFIVEVKLVKQILKYLTSRKYLSVPFYVLSCFEEEAVTNLNTLSTNIEQNDVFEAAVSHQGKFHSVIEKLPHKNFSQLGSNSNIGRRIQISEVSSSSLNTLKGTSAQISSDFTDNQLSSSSDKSVLLTQIINSESADLDNLFSSYSKSSKISNITAIKPEPVLMYEETTNTNNQIPYSSIVKEEPLDNFTDPQGNIKLESGEQETANDPELFSTLQIEEPMIFTDCSSNKSEFIKSEDFIMEDDPLS